MKKQRIIASLLLAAMLLPASGCSAKPDDTSGADADSTAVTDAAETEAQTEAPEYVNPGKDFGGATFTFLDYQTEDYAYYIQTFSDIFADEMNGDPLRDAQYERNQKVQDELNFKLATHPVGGRSRNKNDTELTALILAADTSVDAAFVFANRMSTLITTPGYLQMLNRIDTMNLDASWWDQNVRDALTIYGNVKAITGDISLFYQYAMNVVYFNQEVAQNAHLENLYDTVRAGKWTCDRMMETARAVALDLDGDGKMTDKDRYGFVGQGAFIHPFYASADGEFIRHTADGGYEICLNSEKTSTFIQKYVPQFNDPTLALMADTVSQYGFSNANSWMGLFLPMFANNQVLYYMNQLTLINELRAQEPDFGILPYPKYDENQAEYRSAADLSWTTMLCIPATCTKPDMAGYVCDAMGYYSQQIVMPEIIDKNVRGKSIRDEDSAEMLEIILSNSSFHALSVFGWGSLLSNFNSLGKSNNTNFASMYASCEAAALSAMAETLSEFKKEK